MKTGAVRMDIWRVECPGHHPVMVTAPTEVEAGIEAAKQWGVPWREVAAYLTATSEGTVYKRKCSSCGREYYAGSAAEKYGRCPPCEAERRHERDRAYRSLERQYRLRRERERNA